MSLVATLVFSSACGSSTPVSSSADVSANRAATKNSSPAKPPAEAPPDPPVVFRPEATDFTLSLGKFGPCDIEHDPLTRVSTVFCDKVDAPDQEGILFNFYLPGIWTDSRLTPKYVALQIRDRSPRGTFLEAFFAAPDRPSGKLAFYIVQSAVYPEEQAGQVFLMKVARTGDAVYCRSYSRMFTGPPGDMRERIRTWLLANLDEYGRQLAPLRLGESWSRFLREHRERAGIER